MKTLLVFVLCLAYAAATGCGPLERLKVKSQWEEVYGSTAAMRETLGTEVWTHVFLHEPKLKEHLTRVRADNVNSHEFHAHAVRVFGGFDICISLLNDPDTLNAELSHLHDQHDERGIPHEYFDVFRHGLLHVLSLHVKNFDQDAWTACFDVIKNGIVEGLTE
jgi:hemoglobin-like flavoprotein